MPVVGLTDDLEFWNIPSGSLHRNANDLSVGVDKAVHYGTVEPAVCYSIAVVEPDMVPMVCDSFHHNLHFGADRGFLVVDTVDQQVAGHIAVENSDNLGHHIVGFHWIGNTGCRGEVGNPGSHIAA